jgi:hypothetical protein
MAESTSTARVESYCSSAKKYLNEPWSSPFDPSSVSPDILYELAIHLLQPSSEKLGIPTAKLRSFIKLAQDKYRSNAYHCWAHAVHVTFNAERLFQDLRDVNSFTDLDHFVLLFSALIHDLDHPGHTNLMEIQSKSKLARLYNDQSVIENNSISVSYSLAYEVNLFSDLEDGLQSSLRERSIELVLATDISPPSGKDRALLINAKWNAAFTEGRAFQVETTDQVQNVSVLIIRVADLGSAMQPYSIFANWSHRLYMENNKASGLTQEQHVNTQKPFMEYLCVPLLQFAKKYPIFKSIDMYIDLLQSNLNKWNEMDVPKKCSDIAQLYVVQPGVVQAELVAISVDVKDSEVKTCSGTTDEKE